jgi:digeranylgeranylglycerophospholipid reductase
LRDRYDLVIIGAGFAGLVCARVAAERGLKAAVLDKKPEPGVQLHTTGIMVKEAADELHIPTQFTRKVRGVRLYAPGMKQVDLDSPGYYFLATDTGGVLRWLAEEAAAAGAGLIFGQPFEGARRDDEGITLDRPAIRTRYLVGADGARSQVARFFGLGTNSRMLVGAETELYGVNGIDPDRLHCFLDSELSPGYIGWAVPGLGVTQVGLACRLGGKPDLLALIDKLRDVFDFDDARVAERRSGLIPVGGTVRPFSTDRVLLVGDAAGTVSPLTAGGIHPAFRYGRRAAQVISDHLLDGGPDPGRILAGEYPRYRWKTMLRRGLDRDPPNWLYDWTLGLPPMRSFARLIYFHRKGLKTKTGWGDLFRWR